VDRAPDDGPRRRLTGKNADPAYDPKVEGMVSVDLRPHRLPPVLEKKYPSIGSIIAGLERAHASVEFVDDGLRIEAEIGAKDERVAERTLKVLGVFRDGVREPALRALMDGLSLERVARRIYAKWKLPSRAVLGLLARRNPSPNPTP
jgi:hypothetical protein